MGKQHDTFPGEKPEMPVPQGRPEINRPSDPAEPEVPREDPEVVPDEIPAEKPLPETPTVSRARFEPGSALDNLNFGARRLPCY